MRYFFKSLRLLLKPCSAKILFYVILYNCHKASHKKKLALRNVGKTLCVIMTDLGPAFVKLGQVLSTRQDVINYEIVSEFEKLYDNVTIQNPTTSMNRIRNSFPNTKNITFIAAGSIAEVYKVEVDNNVYAVKLLKQNIEQRFYDNISFISFIIKHSIVLSKKIRMKLLRIVENINITSKSEFNLYMEAATIERMHHSYTTRRCNIKIPKLELKHSTNKMLVMEWIDGISVTDNSIVEKREYIARMVADFVLSQIYIDCFFHADPHIGNFLFHNDSVVALDFGMIGSISKKDGRVFGRIIKAFLEENYDDVAELHIQASYLNPSTKYTFSIACRSIMIAVQNSKKEYAISTLLKELLSIVDNFDIDMNPNLAMMHKGMISLEGFLNHLSVDCLEIIKEWFKKNEKEFLPSTFEKIFNSLKH
ncbi:putative protein kinase UbiB [Candidatus Fokinia solitaria]|uniref:ABC1 atypical kinase-like domain-containing protein n=1 Tax=Candidatus Fokinia solitaria TaxID=1802984 RepID=A0A2U8BR74_9RICK|nr:AarF/UbiB family protein [Candidatus Fokinia solitaria]AWD32828.1 putative protein kinase UbiB [Candidatus Fokinia solitaria]